MNFTSILIYGIYQCKWDQFASMHGKTPDSYSLRKILMVWRYSQIFYPEQIFLYIHKFVQEQLFVGAFKWMGCHCILVKQPWYIGIIVQKPSDFGATLSLLEPSVFGDCTQMVKHWPIRPSDFAPTISLWSLYMCIWTLHLKYKILDNIH